MAEPVNPETLLGAHQSSGVFIVPDDGSNLGLTFDLTLSETHEDVSEVTEHPIETGCNIADHVRQTPLSLALEVFVSNTPLYADILKGRGRWRSFELTPPEYEAPFEPTPGAIFRAAGGAIKAVGDALLGPSAPLKTQLLGFDSGFDAVRETQTILTDLKNRAVTLTVYTMSQVYANMVLTHITLPRTEYGGAAFTLELRQLSTVQSANVAAPKAAEKRGAPSVNKGAQATKATDSAAEASTMYKLLSGMMGG